MIFPNNCDDIFNSSRVDNKVVNNISVFCIISSIICMMYYINTYFVIAAEQVQ